MKRYSRQMILPEIGEAGQQKLLQARVLVIGAGGLGCAVLHNLVAAGVGHIGIVDGDVVDQSNLHRQLLYSLKDCGSNKAQTAKQVLFELNPEIEIHAHAVFLSKENAGSIFEGYHIVVDCTDRIDIRYLISDVSVVKRIPMIYASIHRFEGQLSVFNYKNGPTYRCLFPEDESMSKVPNCAQAGVLGVLPNTMGIMQATEVLKILLGIGTVLSGKLLLYDALHFNMQTIDFAKKPKMIEKGFINGTALLNSKRRAVDLLEDSFFEKCNQQGPLFIDLRDTLDGLQISVENLLKLPLYELEKFSEQLDKNQEIVLFCQSGQRSAKALHYLLQKGFSKVSHLEKGIGSLSKIPGQLMVQKQ